MSREAHVRIWERLGVQLPRATRQVYLKIDGRLVYLWRVSMRACSWLSGGGGEPGHGGLLVMLNRQALTIHQVVFSFRPRIGTREEVRDLDQ